MNERSAGRMLRKMLIPTFVVFAMLLGGAGLLSRPAASARRS